MPGVHNAFSAERKKQRPLKSGVIFGNKMGEYLFIAIVSVFLIEAIGFGTWY